MKSLPALATLSLTLLSVATPVLGQHEAQGGRDSASGRSNAEMRRSFLQRNEPPRADGRGEPTAAQRPDEVKPAPLPGFVAVPGRERLSPEERKQLRRDIHAAGRDIYRRPRPE